MKLTLILFLSVVTLVACTVPEPFNKGKNCVCHEKTCTDVSCEEKNCLCIVKTIKALQSQKDAKYPKKWLAAYLQLVQERCLCIQGCQKICSPSEFVICTSAAFDRFQCKYQKWLEGIIGDKGYDLFAKDINNLIADCLNKDCKPICSGDGDCNPFYIEPKDCGCTQKCVEQFILGLIKDLKDDDAAESLKFALPYIKAYYLQLQKCYKNTNPGQQKMCITIARSEIDRILQELREDLIKSSGSCAAIGIMSAIFQGVAECALKK